LIKGEWDNFDRMKPDLENMVAKSDRNIYSRKAMIQRIKKQNNFKEFPGNLNVFYTLVDSTIFSKEWVVPDMITLTGYYSHLTIKIIH